MIPGGMTVLEVCRHDFDLVVAKFERTALVLEFVPLKRSEMLDLASKDTIWMLAVQQMRRQTGVVNALFDKP